jgi:anti-anti-sigma regulatory factor
MLRITAAETPRLVTLRLEGCIAAEWVAELRNECQRWLEDGRRLCLDLQHVTFVDRRGALMLRELACERLRILSCPALVRETLNTVRPDRLLS